MAIVANLVIDQGSDFNSTLTLEDTVGNALDLTNYTIRGLLLRLILLLVQN
jgi:hypothetical protein